MFNDRKIKYEEIKHFRNDDIIRYLTSLDIEEVVETGGYFVDVLERYICDTSEYNPFERFIIDMTNKRNKNFIKKMKHYSKQ